MNAETLTTIAIGLAAAIGFAVRSWADARVKTATAEERDAQTHATAVDAIERARAAAELRAAAEELAHGETKALLAAAEGRERALLEELSRHMQGRVVVPQRKG